MYMYFCHFIDFIFEIWHLSKVFKFDVVNHSFIAYDTYVICNVIFVYLKNVFVVY